MSQERNTRHLKVIMVLVIFLFHGLFACHAAPASERILDFQSRVECQGDASIIVEERITVQSEARAILHGIYRDLPLQNWAGRPSRLLIESALLDGSPVTVKEVLQSRSSRILLGNPQAILHSGRHVFTLRYRMSGQIGNLKDRDEIYWNVTGNEWTFPIEHASCVILPPAGTEGGAGLKVAAYTGPRGSKNRDAEISISANEVRLETTRPLQTGEGLTAAVGWPKGHVAFGSWKERNPGWIAFALGMGLVLLYYIVAWFFSGRDTPAGIVIPRFEPPPGMTPAEVRRLARMGLDIKGFASEIVDLAVKGILIIRESEGRFSLSMQREPSPGNLPLHQRELVNALLSTGLNSTRRIESMKSLARQGGLMGTLARIGLKMGKVAETPALQGPRVEIPLEESANKEIHAIWVDFKRRIESSTPSRRLFSRNTGKWAFGLLGSMGAISAMLYANHPRGIVAGGGAFLLLWLSLWTVGVVLLVGAACSAWKSALKAPSCSGTGRAIFLAVFATPFVGAEIFVLFTLSRLSFTPLATQLLPALAAAIGAAALFKFLLRRYTSQGQAAMDSIEGYRQYLSMAEQGMLHTLAAPSLTPELFERHLPFAMALDVEEAWTARFTALLGADYSPAWVRGGLKPGSMAFSSHFANSFTAAVSTAGSSSGGSGGGGSSGGGGGGGGGGGW